MMSDVQLRDVVPVRGRMVEECLVAVRAVGVVSRRRPPLTVVVVADLQPSQQQALS
jgi:hypothetical protein